MKDIMTRVKDQKMQIRAGLMKQCQLQSGNFAKELFTQSGTLSTVHQVKGVEVLRAVKAKYSREPSDYKSIEPPLSTLEDKNARNKTELLDTRFYNLEIVHTQEWQIALPNAQLKRRKKKNARERRKNKCVIANQQESPPSLPRPLFTCLPRKDIQHITISRLQHYISHIITVWRCVLCKASPLCTAVCGTR